VSTPTFNPDGGTWFITQQRTVTVTTSTIGANMRYTINGAPPTSTTGTLISGSSWPVTVTPSPQGTTLRVIAYKAGMIDSQVHEAVFYYENDNGGNTNMAYPIDGGPGGGGILIDGGDQPTINYDANGNLTKYKGWTYGYDAQNRLINAVNGSVSAQFYYDGKNRQIAHNINGVIRFNSWDGWELLEEYSSSLNVATGYLQGTTGVIKSWSAANTLYYYQDKLGSTTHIASASGQLVESYHYNLAGTPTETSTHGVVDLYAGERWIPELALYDLRNRFMSPELGRFLQADPIGFQGDASNLYRYCGDDPVNRSDPTGLLDTSASIWNHLAYMEGGSFLNPDQFDKIRQGEATLSFSFQNKSEAKTDQQTYKSFNDAAAVQKEAAYDMMGRDHEAGTEIWQRDDGSSNYRSDRPRPGDGLYKIKDGVEKGKRMLGFEVDPSRHPKGYHIAGWMYAHPFYRPEVPPNDQRRAFNRGWNVYLVTPARADRQQFGLRNVVTYRYPDRPTD
jgi:RHS repeat-associated protein